MTAALMDDFPPAPDRLVTLANWRKAPFCAWGFRNVRRLIPTANIAASGAARALETSLEEIGHIGFNGHDGEPTTVGRALRATHTDAFVVLRRGRIAMEWYGHGMSAATPHIVFSVSKSICGTLGGILVDRGLLDPDDGVIDYIPELADSVYAGCTIRHLLDMAVGIAFNEDYEDPRGDVVRYRHAAGWDPLPAGETPIDGDAAKSVAQRLEWGHPNAPPVPQEHEAGAKVFAARCAQCHRNGGATVPLALQSSTQAPVPDTFTVSDHSPPSIRCGLTRYVGFLACGVGTGYQGHRRSHG